MLMSVPPTHTTAIQMQPVPTLKAHSLVPVTQGTVEMEPAVQILMSVPLIHTNAITHTSEIREERVVFDI